MLPNVPPAAAMPPLLAKLVAQQKNTGLPPAYVPKDEQQVGAADGEQGEPS